MSLAYSAAWAVSGTSTMMTSAQADASAGVFTVSPAARAFSRDRLFSGSPTRTCTPLSFRLSACACPCEPKPITATFFALMSARSASPS